MENLVQGTTVLNYCRWIVSYNCVVKYNVGDDSHDGWYVNEHGRWCYRVFDTYEVKRMVSRNHTVLPAQAFSCTFGNRLKCQCNSRKD